MDLRSLEGEEKKLSAKICKLQRRRYVLLQKDISNNDLAFHAKIRQIDEDIIQTSRLRRFLKSQVYRAKRNRNRGDYPSFC